MKGGPPLAPNDRVLVINLAGVGDLVLATPALHALRRWYPTNPIALLVSGHAAHLLEHCPDVDQQWALTSTREGLWWWSHLAQDQQVLRQLRAQQFALAVDLYAIHSWWGSLRMAYYLRQIQPRRSLGYNVDGRGWCFTQPLVQSSEAFEQTHEAAHALQLVQQVGCEPVALVPQLWVTEEERHTAQRQLATWGLTPHAFVVLSPGAHQPEKRWPVERFVQLGQWLMDRCHVRLLLVGDTHDRQVGGVLAHQLSTCAVNRVGQTSVRELMALITQARAVISHDTGTMHIAAALQRPLVALFGPTNPVRFAPLGGAARQHVLQAPSRRIEDVELADVQQAIEDLLSRTPNDEPRTPSLA